MNGMPFVHVMPSIGKDCRDCLEFIARQPWGNPAARGSDIAIRHRRVRNVFSGVRDQPAPAYGGAAAGQSVA